MPFQYTFRADDLESVKAEDRDLMENRDRELELYLGTVGTYVDFTPNWTNLTVGNGTTIARYSQIGKMVHYYVQFTMGSTSVMGTSPYLTVPVTNKASVIQPSHVGFARNAPTGPNYNLQCIVFEDGKMYLTVLGGSNFTATSPFTWATDDFFIISGVYEAA